MMIYSETNVIIFMYFYWMHFKLSVLCTWYCTSYNYARLLIAKFSTDASFAFASYTQFTHTGAKATILDFHMLTVVWTNFVIILPNKFATDIFHQHYVELEASTCTYFFLKKILGWGCGPQNATLTAYENFIL